MNKIYLLLAVCLCAFFSQAQSWIFYPQQTISKFATAANGNWTQNSGQSTKTTYTYQNGKLQNYSTKTWNGGTYVINSSSIMVDYVYNGEQINYTVLKFWNGSTYEINDNSIKTAYFYNQNNQIDYTITYYRSNGSWYIAWEYITAQSIKTEYYYANGKLDYTVTKYYNGSSWTVEYEYVWAMSIKTVYLYTNDQLTATENKYYNGSSWINAWSGTNNYARSIRTEYTYKPSGHLDYTIGKYWNGSTWYIQYQSNSANSMKLEYTDASTLGVDSEAAISPVSIYPNPSNGKFHVVADGVQISSAAVFNLAGEKVLGLENASEINLEGFPKGAYFVQLTAGEHTYTEKLIVE